MTTSQRPSFATVYDGKRALGFLLPRGRAGVAAFDIEERSLGVFPDQKAAADAVSRAAQAASASTTQSKTP
jgi:hypothetical protein